MAFINLFKLLIVCTKQLCKSSAVFGNILQTIKQFSIFPAYYGLVGNFVDIENDLAKARVMTDGKLLKENLMNIDVNCNLASQNLQVFYANNDGMHNLMSYINQLGDYCVFLPFASL